MPQGLRWAEVLHNIDNKTDLLDLFLKYMQSPECRSKLPCDFIVTSKERTVKLNNQSIQILENCNHEEAATRLVLLVWAYFAFDIKCKWYMNMIRIVLLIFQLFVDIMVLKFVLCCQLFMP